MPGEAVSVFARERGQCADSAHEAPCAGEGRLQWSLTEVLANVALFVPAGFLLSVVFGAADPERCSVRPWLGMHRHRPAGLRPSRVPSIADVQHNGLGGLLGAVLAWPLFRLLMPDKQPMVAYEGMLG